MQVQSVSFKNNVRTKHNQQNVGFSGASTTFASEETQRIKESKIVKYLLVGAGVLTAIVAAVNYKKVGILFNNKIKTVKTLSEKASSQKKDFVPANKLMNTFAKPFVESENYELWHFTSDAFLEQFVKAHEDVFEEYKKTKLDECGLWNLKAIKDFAGEGREEFTNLVSKVKNKIGVDLSQEVRHYRFIGDSEFDVLRSRMPVESRSYGQIYVSLCPEPKYDVPRFSYRVTFKNTDNIMSNMGSYHDMSYKSTIQGSYYPSDVGKVEKLVNGYWQEVNLDAPKNQGGRVLVKVK